MNKRIKMTLVLLLAALLSGLSGCGMKSSWENERALAVSSRLMADTVTAMWSVSGGLGGSGEPAMIRLKLVRADGTPIEAFEEHHEKLLHLIVVSRDLSAFAHLHPVYRGEGVFEVEHVFPSGGTYRFIADFKPVGGDAISKLGWVQVVGNDAPASSALRESTDVEVSGGLAVGLEAAGLQAGKEAALTFTITESITGRPVTNLEPYLGAIGHVVVLSEDGERYVHVHAETGQGTGPEAKFEAAFPGSGLYKVWAQFQRDGQVVTTSYVVNVPAGNR
ncbi:hypothetical protein J31TS4_06480 [Paenibacillus sp. J31TS4]|uniref:hypothetical protein n=1 Tax=Paenibacillus sp. J31TS4 TaxID=2807195 RepID=UPI001B2BF3D7|nr:hypothetical protein [Paenibacillus sp. J31TS4]GIP37368.1 hypothetical protein J31TS4_06480 [Paenibacillus sp. J31TS4]